MTERNRLVRRASRAFLALRRRLGFPWRPTDIDGCVLWLRPSAGVSATVGLVTRWRDRAGRNATESSGALDAPLFVARAASLNQRASIRFGGTCERLESVRGIRQPLASQGFSVFAVLSPWAFGAHGASLLRWSGWTADVGLELDARNRFVGRVETRHDSGVHLMGGRPYLIGLTFKDTTATLHVNRAVARTIRGLATCDNDVEAPARLSIGGDASGRDAGPSGQTSGFRGDLGDVVIYDHALEPPEVDALTAGLLLHYGLLGARWLDLPRTNALLLGGRRS